MKKKAIEFSLKAEKQEFPVAKIRSSKDSADFARQFYYDDISIYESSFILLMNQSNTAIGYAKIAQGGICSTIVDVRLIAKYAVESLAVSVILVHNHPSGNLQFSRDDIRLAQQVRNGLSTLGIDLLDSIVICENGYASMADEGLL
jgi:DNA repair protein RadC